MPILNCLAVSSSVKFSEFLQSGYSELHWDALACGLYDGNSLLHENQSTIIVDPSGDVRLKEVQNNRSLMIVFIPITIMWEKVFI